jgi:L-ascorbate metabolism protein UlaG (beta-lactamase superfamily)
VNNFDTTQGESLKVDLLNHASVIMHFYGIRLLTDPWYIGTCCRDGWGLRYRNDSALEKAASATHLWISHFHDDHLHMPTLKALAEKNPDIPIFANESHNFQMEPPLRAAGFRQITKFHERKPVCINDYVTITRYPTTGIDNMLLIETPGWTILNYNDVNIPIRSLKMLMRKIPKIDLLLLNFTHAGKLIENPLKEPEEIRSALAESVLRRVNSINPTWVIPFASFHWYLDPLTAEQNKTLWDVSEMKVFLGKTGQDTRSMLPIHAGQQVEWKSRTESPQLTGRKCDDVSEELDFKMKEKRSEGELLRGARDFKKRVTSKSLMLKALVKPFPIWVTDLEKTLVMTKQDCYFSEENRNIEISADSGSLGEWFGGKYGATNGFWIGGHFKIQTNDVSSLGRLLFFAALEEEELSPRDLLGYAFSLGGLKFLWCRREEILGTLMTGAFRVGQRD